VRVAMLLASIEGSIGMGVPLGPVAELANPVNRPGKPTLGCRSGPTAPRCRRVGFSRSRRRQQQESALSAYSLPGAIGSTSQARRSADDHAFTIHRSDHAGRQQRQLGLRVSAIPGPPSGITRQPERPRHDAGHPPRGVEGCVHHRGSGQPAPLRDMSMPSVSRLGRAPTPEEGCRDPFGRSGRAGTPSWRSAPEGPPGAANRHPGTEKTPARYRHSG
jgi:hypothetical protein